MDILEPLRHLRTALKAQDGWAAIRLCTQANNFCTAGMLLLCCLFSHPIVQQRLDDYNLCHGVSQEMSPAFRFAFVLMFLNTVLSILFEQRTMTQEGRSSQSCPGSSQKYPWKQCFCSQCAAPCEHGGNEEPGARYQGYLAFHRTDLKLWCTAVIWASAREPQLLGEKLHFIQTADRVLQWHLEDHGHSWFSCRLPHHGLVGALHFPLANPHISLVPQFSECKVESIFPYFLGLLWGYTHAY